MLEGLPAFVDYAIVMAQRQPHRDALAVVLYDLTSHLVKAVQYTMTHTIFLCLWSRSTCNFQLRLALRRVGDRHELGLQGGRRRADARSPAQYKASA